MSRRPPAPACPPLPPRRDTSPYRHFTAEEWGRLRNETPLPLTEDELGALRGRGETVSLDEVSQIYLPLSRLLNLHVSAAQHLYSAANGFLGRKHVKTPYIIGVAGSVAVGKSTTSRILRLLLARWPNHPKVALVTTDGFLHPNAWLEVNGLMERKGWPESFDLPALLQFMAEVKSGRRQVVAPVYSHEAYNIIPDGRMIVDRPDILILEGLNVLQGGAPESARAIAKAPSFVSDFFDFSIYIDADEPVVRNWYIDRFLGLHETAFQKPNAYFHRYASLRPDEATRVAEGFWESINRPNLERNILPTRLRADLILRKRADHAISEVWMRKL